MERPRCVHCRNPIKDHQAAVGPTEGDRTFHEDCWTAAHPDAVACAPSVASADDRPVAAASADDRPVAAAEQLVEQRQPESSSEASEASEAEPSSDQPVAEASSEQRDYERSIASGGLAALLSPYVKGLPAQRNSAESVPA